MSINNLRQFTDLTEQIGSMLMQCKSDMFSSKHGPTLSQSSLLNQLNNAFIICEEGEGYYAGAQNKIVLLTNCRGEDE